MLKPSPKPYGPRAAHAIESIEYMRYIICRNSDPVSLIMIAGIVPILRDPYIYLAAFGSIFNRVIDYIQKELLQLFLISDNRYAFFAGKVYM